MQEEQPKSKRGILAVLLILLVIIAVITVFLFYSAPESPILNLEELTVNVSFSGAIKFSATDRNYSVDTFNIETYSNAFNREVQEVLQIGASHPYSIKKDEWGNEVLVLNLGTSKAGRTEYEVWSVVKTRPRTSAVREIGETISLAYTNSSKHVQSSSTITNLAGTLTEEAETKYDEAAAITLWVHNNIEYDLSTENVTKDALWVLENRIGVCVEYAHLELALLRARDIPARLVYGVAPYEYPDGWRTHSWVEARIDGAWITFDPTWNEIGTLDAAHITLAVVPDQSYVTEKAELTGANLKLDYMEAPELRIKILGSKSK